jgi:broad specificity phosphatase PhoE
MTARLTLICHAATTATRSGAFPLDEPIEAKAAALIGSATRTLRADRALASPALRARETAELLGLTADIEPQLRDCDYGGWAGRSLAEIEAEQQQALAEWLTNPGWDGHGGESITAVVARISLWLDARKQHDGRLIAITHTAIMRAAIVYVLGAPAPAFWRIDIAPLTRVTLSGHQGRWNLTSIEPMSAR